jgi:glutathione S-transferase
MKLYDHPMSANCLKPRTLLAQLGTTSERVTVDIFDRYPRTRTRRGTSALSTRPRSRTGSGASRRRPGSSTT